MYRRISSIRTGSGCVSDQGLNAVTPLAGFSETVGSTAISEPSGRSLVAVAPSRGEEAELQSALKATLWTRLASYWSIHHQWRRPIDGHGAGSGISFVFPCGAERRSCRSRKAGQCRMADRSVRQLGHAPVSPDLIAERRWSVSACWICTVMFLSLVQRRGPRWNIWPSSLFVRKPTLSC